MPYNSHMKFLLYSVALMLSLSFAARAQTVTGVFNTSIGGQPAITESYRLATQPDGSLRAEAEVGPAAAGAARQKTVTVATAGGRPVSFSVEAGGASVLTAEFAGETVKLGAAGQASPRQLPAKATVILENLVWHHFHFLLVQYDEKKGGQQRFTFYLPTQAREFEIVVDAPSAQAYDIGGRQARTRLFRMTSAGQLELKLWTDEAGRTPLLFQVEAQSVRAVRQGMEALAEAAFAPAAKAAPQWQPPAYARPESFREQEVTVGAGSEWALPGTLSVPKGVGPFPAVVLVHGSGPNDRDESYGPNKTFRDLAWGLASQGVVVLRYDKRTKVHAAKMGQLAATLTVKEEVIDDALAALDLLRRTTPGIDARHVFLLGHSLGGTLAPRVAARDPLLAGLVIMAGATEPLEEAIVRQYEYMAALDGAVDAAERAEIDKVKAQAARVKALKPESPHPDPKETFNVAAAYWLDLRGYDPAQSAGRLKLPILLIQGERDYQVTLKDFGNWRRALDGRGNVTAKSYPKLNHLFLEGEGPGTPAEYLTPGHVPQSVVDDIAAWVKGQKKN
ncbi:MAG: alpha/beta hydrolase family protein [Pyrinomonadaceae bacterium]